MDAIPMYRPMSLEELHRAITAVQLAVQEARDKGNPEMVPMMTIARHALAYGKGTKAGADTIFPLIRSIQKMLKETLLPVESSKPE